MPRLDDDSPMPFGKYRGKAMAEVPASYLLWLYRQTTKLDTSVHAYIIDNLDVLKKEEEEEKQKYRKNYGKHNS